MKNSVISLGRCFAAAILPLTCTAVAVLAQTTTYSTIANFKPYNNDAIEGISRVTFDQAGNLFGISLSGGVYGEGAVYEASPTTDGKWTHKVISSFRYNPPTGFVTLGADQNVYGVASEEGDVGSGAIFRLTRANKGTWKRTDLYSFDDPAGGLYPITGVVFDQSGNLFGSPTRVENMATATTGEVLSLSSRLKTMAVGKKLFCIAFLQRMEFSPVA